MIFADREEAGKLLAEDLREKIDLNSKPLLVAIPRGGVPVAYSISQELNIPMSIVVVRKLGIPWNKEVGFGSVDPDGSVYLDEWMVKYARLDDETVRRIADEELKEIRKRERLFVPRGYPNFRGREIIVVDDGVATGYTAIAATEFVKRRGARKVTVASPVCPAGSSKKFEDVADMFVCHYVSPEENFAVGMFYRDFSQLTDSEVIEYLNRARERGLLE